MPAIASCFCALAGALGVEEPSRAPREDAAGPARAAPIVVMVRAGKLAMEEVMPASRSSAPTLWNLALEGVTLTHVERPLGPADVLLFEDFRREVLPVEVLDPMIKRGSLVEIAIDVEASTLNRVKVPRTEAPGPSQALRSLQDVFRPAPPPLPDETAALAALSGALSRPEGRPRPATPAPVRWEDEIRLEKIAAADVSLLRVIAEESSEDDIRRREALLVKVLELAGRSASVIVVNLPRDGPGTLVARGPRFKASRVIEKKKTLAAVTGTVASLLDEAAEKSLPAVREEEVRELFR